MINARVREVFRRSFGFPREFNEEEDDGGFPAVSVIRCVWEWLENSRKVQLNEHCAAGGIKTQ